jgi:hypothetical protein
VKLLRFAPPRFALRRSALRRLDEMGLEEKGMGWHSFKRFRKTWLRGHAVWKHQQLVDGRLLEALSEIFHQHDAGFIRLGQRVDN